MVVELMIKDDSLVTDTEGIRGASTSVFTLVNKVARPFMGQAIKQKRQVGI